MKLLTAACLSFSLHLLTPSLLSAQSDSSIYPNPVQHLVSLYLASQGEQSSLYNGTEAEAYAFVFGSTHPYFGSANWTIGSVWYDGILYRDVPLMYDLIKDELQVQHWNKVTKIRLVPEKVEAFTLNGHHFIRVGADSSGALPREGFYELLAKGSATVLARKEKNIQQIMNNARAEIRVYEKKRYYVVQGGNSGKVKNRRSFLFLLRDKKTELQRFLKSSTLSFDRDFESALKAVATYYNQITDAP